MTLWVGTLKVNHYPIEFGGQRKCGSGDISFNLSRDLARPRDQRIVRFYG